MNNVVELMPERVEVWSAHSKEENQTIWFISYWKDGAEMIVHDGPTEEGAIVAANEWGIPVVLRKDLAEARP